MLIVGIMGEPHQIASQFLCPVQQHSGIFFRVGPSGFQGFLLMNIHGFDKYRIAVQENPGISHFNGSETDIVCYGIRSDSMIT